MKKQLGLLVAIALMATGCNLNPITGLSAHVATPQTSITADSPANVSMPMTTQIDEHSGVAFDYPIGWTISPPPPEDAVAYSYSIASFDLANPPITPSKSQQGLPAGETEIQVNFHTADATVDSIRSDLQADVASGRAKILKEQVRTGPDGTESYYYQIEGMFEGTAQLVQTSVNGHTLSVVAYGEGTNFEDVVKSLRAA
jgi:hypothetical protein